MKKRCFIAFLTTVILIMSAVLSSANEGTLKLVSTYPKDGQKNTSVENVGVKLKFNNPVSAASVRENNIKALKIENKKTGEKLPVKVLFNKNAPEMVLVLGDNSDGKLSVSNNSEYELVIDKSFSDDEGNQLGETKVLTFTTFNQKLNNTVNMVMMVVMFGGIAFYTIRQQKKNGSDEKEPDQKVKKDSINPYKEAKRTGKTVEEIVAIEKKKEQKKNKRRSSGNQQGQAEKKAINLAELLPYVHHVREPRPISSAGGKYKNKQVKAGE